MNRLTQRFRRGDQEVETAGLYLVLSLVLHLSGLVNTPLIEAGWGWLPVLLLGLGALLLRRRWLVAAALVMSLCGAALIAFGSMSGYFLLFEAVFSIFLLGSAPVRRVTAGVLIALCAAVTVVGLCQSTAQATVLNLFVLGFLFLTPMFWADNVRTARQLAQVQAERAQVLSQRAEALASAAEDNEQRLKAEHHAALVDERTALAREMHDVLSARLSSIALISGAALSKGATSELRAIREESVQALEEMTDMVRMLHSGTPALAARLGDIPQLVAASVSPVELTYLVPEPDRLPIAVHTAAHRTVRELLVNHAKHAPGSIMTLQVKQESGALSIIASNPVTGAPEPGAGIGLANIRTRSDALGGACTVTRGAQFSVAVRLPTEES